MVYSYIACCSVETVAFPTVIYTHRQVDESQGYTAMDVTVDVEKVYNAGPHPQEEEGNRNGEKLVLEDIDRLPELLLWYIVLCSFKLFRDTQHY